MARVLTDREIVLAKVGATPTTDDVITLSDYAQIDIKIKTEDYKEIGRGLGASTSYSVADFTTASGSLNLLLRSGLPPKYAELFKMCAMDEELVTDDDGNVTEAHYKPTQSPVSGTIIRYLDDEKRTITGVMGDFKISFEVGMAAKTTFDIKGFTAPIPEAETNPSVTLDDSTIFIVESIDVVTIGGNTYEVESVEFTMNNDIKEIYAISAKEYQITDYKPTITIKDYKLKGDTTAWSDIANGNVREIYIKLSNADGRTFEFSAKNARFKDLSESDNSGNIENTRTYALEKDSNGINFEIVYK